MQFLSHNLQETMESQYSEESHKSFTNSEVSKNSVSNYGMNQLSEDDLKEIMNIYKN